MRTRRTTDEVAEETVERVPALSYAKTPGKGAGKAANRTPKNKSVALKNTEEAFAPALEEAEGVTTEASAGPTTRARKTPRRARKAAEDTPAITKSSGKGSKAAQNSSETAKKAAKEAKKAKDVEKAAAPALDKAEEVTTEAAAGPAAQASKTPRRARKAAEDTPAVTKSSGKGLKAARKLPKTAKKAAKGAIEASLQVQQSDGDIAGQDEAEAADEIGQDEAEAADDITQELSPEDLATKSASLLPRQQRRPYSGGQVAFGEADAVLPPVTYPDIDEDDNDEEAPEEVSLKTGKAAAVEQRRAERQADTALRQAAKQKRRRRSEATVAVPSTSAEEAENGTEVVALRKKPEEGGHAGSDNEEADEDADMLPDDVIAALQSQARDRAAEEAMTRGVSEEGLGPSGRADERPQAKRARLTERRVGPVTVQVLTAKRPSKPSVSAVEFARQKLQGARVQRSATMLQPTRIAGTPIYTAAVEFGKSR